MNTNKLFTLLLSCTIASTTFGLTSKASIVKRMQHMQNNKSNVTAPYAKTTVEHPDFTGNWQGRCEHVGSNAEWDPDRTYNSTLEVSLLLNTISLSSQTDSIDKPEDDWSNEYVIGGVDNSSHVFPASSLSGLSAAAWMYTSKDTTYWADQGQKLVFTSVSSTHNLEDPNSYEGPYFNLSADSTDETSIELVDGKLVYTSISKWSGFDKSSSTKCIFTKVDSE